MNPREVWPALGARRRGTVPCVGGIGAVYRETRPNVKEGNHAPAVVRNLEAPDKGGV